MKTRYIVAYVIVFIIILVVIAQFRVKDREHPGLIEETKEVVEERRAALQNGVDPLDSGAVFATPVKEVPAVRTETIQDSKDSVENTPAVELKVLQLPETPVEAKIAASEEKPAAVNAAKKEELKMIAAVAEPPRNSAWETISTLFLEKSPEPAKTAVTEERTEPVVSQDPYEDAKQKILRERKLKNCQTYAVALMVAQTPSLETLMLLRRDIFYLSPPEDINAQLQEMIEINTALRRMRRVSASARMRVEVPEDCLALPTCLQCNGHGRVRRNPDDPKKPLDYTTCESCKGTGVMLDEAPRFDPGLARDAFRNRAEYVAVWLKLLEDSDVKEVEAMEFVPVVPKGKQP